jgi:hypothetical protein
MEAEDVVRQLMARMPQLTDLFSTNIDALGLTSSGTTVTANVPAHGLTVGSLFAIEGAHANCPIASIVRVGTVATVTTSVNHDLTFDIQQQRILKTQNKPPLSVDLKGATESEFVGNFELLSVPNRTNFTVRVDDAGPSNSSGSPYVIDGVSFSPSSTSFSYNGTFNVSAVVDVDNIQYETPKSFPLPADITDGEIKLKKDFQISRSATFERAKAAYTSQKGVNAKKIWLFVVTDDIAASKDRHTQSDGVAVIGRQNDPRQQVLFPVSVFAFRNVTTEIAGAETKDLMNSDILSALFQSLLGSKIPTPLKSGTVNQLVFVQAGLFDYDSSFYAHAFQFERISDISFEDTVGYSPDVAFRDITFTMEPVFSLDE